MKHFFHYLFIVAVIIISIFLFWEIKRLRNENELLKKRIDNLQSLEKEKFLHFSIDDFFFAFKDITENEDEYKSIFRENDFFSRFKMLHDKYGIVLSCFCYYQESPNFSLENVTRKFRDEFVANSDWLKFGFHAFDPDSNYDQIDSEKSLRDYEFVINNLIEIVGKEGIDRVPRVHFYKGNADDIISWKNGNMGILGLLTADDDRISYYLTKDSNRVLRESDYICDSLLYLFPTDLRLEKMNVKSFENDFLSYMKNENTSNYMILFSHEWALNNDIFNMFSKAAELAVCNDYNFAFPQQIINK